MGIFSTQVTSRSQQLNPCSCSMYSKCSCNSEVDVMFSEDKENGPGGRGLLGQHSQNAEKRRWIWAGLHYRTKLQRTAEPWRAPCPETTMWMAPPSVLPGTTWVSVLGTVPSCILSFVWLPHVEISLQFGGNPNYRKAGPHFPLWSPKEIHISPSPQFGCGQVSK